MDAAGPDSCALLPTLGRNSAHCAQVGGPLSGVPDATDGVPNELAFLDQLRAFRRPDHGYEAAYSVIQLDAARATHRSEL
jgi:hypothetical protein